MGCPTCVLLSFISQAGAILGTGLLTDTAGHGTCWDAGSGSPGASVPNHCFSPASVVGSCTSPRLCALPLLTLSDCSEGQCISAAPESRRMLPTRVHAHTHVYVHTDTVLVLASLPGQPLKNDTLEEEEKKKENDNEGGELQVLCRGEREW